MVTSGVNYRLTYETNKDGRGRPCEWRMASQDFNHVRAAERMRADPDHYRNVLLESRNFLLSTNSWEVVRPSEEKGDKKPLSAGQRLLIDLDPLFHGNNMSVLRIEVQILDVSGCPQYAKDGRDVDIDVATYRILSQVELDYKTSEPMEQGTDNWGDEVGQIHAMVSVDGARWSHSWWGVGVEFVSDEKLGIDRVISPEQGAPGLRL